jgi:heat-inducible transcriptional repressor
MVRSSKLTQEAMQHLSDELSRESDPEVLLAHASEILSELTQFAGVVVLPNYSLTRFYQLEFMPLSDSRVLAILVTEDGRVQNRVLPIQKKFTESELVEAANYFNHRYKGHTLEDVRRSLVKDMQTDNDEMHRLNQSAMLAASQVIAEEDEKNAQDVVFSGEQQLLNVPDLCQIETLQKLFDAFKTKRDLLNLLDRSMKAEGISVFIGEESGYSALGECSVIASPYEVDGQVIGTLGVIGPTRMAYDEVISIVDITSRLVSQALNSRAHR